MRRQKIFVVCFMLILAIMLAFFAQFASGVTDGVWIYEMYTNQDLQSRNPYAPSDSFIVTTNGTDFLINGTTQSYAYRETLSFNVSMSYAAYGLAYYTNMPNGIGGSYGSGFVITGENATHFKISPYFFYGLVPGSPYFYLAVNTNYTMDRQVFFTPQGPATNFNETILVYSYGHLGESGYLIGNVTGFAVGGPPSWTWNTTMTTGLTSLGWSMMNTDWWDHTFYSYLTMSSAVQGSASQQYYFRSDTYETLGVSAYGLDSDYTNIYLTSNVTFPLIYGFRAWLVSSAIVSTELTSGTPTAWIYLNGSETYDSYSSTWTCPETTVNLGYQALKVTVYASDDLEEWTALASYITPVLITKQIETSEWTFTLQVAFDDGNAVYSWGDSSHRSGVSGIIFTEPLESEIQLWRINTGDYVGFVLGAYIDVIGEAFYVLCLIGVAGTFYFRYRNFGVIVFFFSIFGGVGGLVWFLVPPWAAAVASALIIVGASFIVWRVIR